MHPNEMVGLYVQHISSAQNKLCKFRPGYVVRAFDNYTVVVDWPKIGRRIEDVDNLVPDASLDAKGESAA